MAEQTLTINTLAATVITPSDVSQFSLDDIAPNIINGGGGTIVDVSGIVALASQVAELDSDVTVLEANVADLQEDVVDLQNAVGGLDTAVAQAQTTATAAASTANAAVATANSAKSTAQYALRSDTAQYALMSGTATELKYEDWRGNTSALKAKTNDGNRLYIEGEDGRRLSFEATTLNYVTPNNREGYLSASVSDGQITFRDQNDGVLSVSGGSSSGGDVSELTYDGTTYLSVEGGATMFYGDADNIYIDGYNPSGVASLKETILQYAQGGSDEYPPLVQRSDLYYGIINDNSSLRFGSFGDANGSQEEAVVKVSYDNIYVTARSTRGSNSALTYGLASTPEVFRVGSWNPDNSNVVNMRKGMYMPGGRHMAVGSFVSTDSTRVWGLMADDTTAAFGNVSYTPDGTICVYAGMQVSEQYVLLSPAGSVSPDTSLKLTSSGATLSAMFTLNNGETSISPTDWAKLKSLADNAEALLNLLQS